MAVFDLQSQIQDIRSSLASHLDKVKASTRFSPIKRPCNGKPKPHCELKEDRRRTTKLDHEQEWRRCFDPEENDEADVNIIAAMMLHELESVKEAEEGRRDQGRHDEPSSRLIQEMQSEAEAEAEGASDAKRILDHVDPAPKNLYRRIPTIHTSR